jgi:predicted HNH restriction endonuclease
LNDCAIEATDVHHLFSGRNKDKYYLDMSTWKAVCRNCHRAIHNYLSAEEAIKLGLKRVE